MSQYDPYAYFHLGFSDKKAIFNSKWKVFFLCNSGNKSLIPMSHCRDWLLTDQWGPSQSRAAHLTVDIYQRSRWSPVIDKITLQPWGLWSSFCLSGLLVSVKLFSSRLPSFLLTVCWPLSQNLVQNSISLKQSFEFEAWLISNHPQMNNADFGVWLKIQKRTFCT